MKPHRNQFALLALSALASCYEDPEGIQADAIITVAVSETGTIMADGVSTRTVEVKVDRRAATSKEIEIRCSSGAVELSAKSDDETARVHKEKVPVDGVVKVPYRVGR